MLQALSAGKLYADPDSRQVYFTDDADALHDAKTGAARRSTSPPTRSRRCGSTTASATSSRSGRSARWTSLSPDPAKRLSAAHAVFDSHDANQLAPVETAIGKETDSGVKAALVQARAAILATKADATPDQQLDAIGVLKARGDQDALGLLSSK